MTLITWLAQLQNCCTKISEMIGLSGIYEEQWPQTQLKMNGWDKNEWDGMKMKWMGCFMTTYNANVTMIK